VRSEIVERTTGSMSHDDDQQRGWSIDAVTKAIVAKRTTAGNVKLTTAEPQQPDQSSSQTPEERWTDDERRRVGTEGGRGCERQQSEGKRTDSEIEY